MTKFMFHQHRLIKQQKILLQKTEALFPCHCLVHNKMSIKKIFSLLEELPKK